MKHQLTCATLVKATALATALLAAGCAQAVAESAESAEKTEKTETIDLKKINDKTQLVLVTNGDTKTFDWSAAQLSDPVELEKALAEVPEAKREKIKHLLSQMKVSQMKGSQMKDGEGFQFASDGGHNMVVHQLGDNADGIKVLTNKKVIVHKIDGGDGSEFSLLKSLLTNSKLTKEQLQELQKILDSKY